MTRPAPDPDDPKGLIRESFRIDGITESECRSILMESPRASAVRS